MVLKRKHPFILSTLLLASLMAGEAASASEQRLTSNKVPMPIRAVHLSQQSAKPPILDALSKQYGSYIYSGYRAYPEARLGYSLRYQHELDNHHADIYIYPVSETGKTTPRNSLIAGEAKKAVNDIYAVQAAGYYSNVRILSYNEEQLNTLPVAMYKLTYSQAETRNFSLLYLTEVNGLFIKARLTQVDTPDNRLRSEPHQFLNQCLNELSLYLAS